MNLRLVFILLLIFPNLAFAQNYDEPCIDAPNERPSNDTNISGMTLSDEHKTILDLMIQRNNFKDVNSLFGNISVFRRYPGCASCGEEACYSSKEKDIAIIFYRYTSWDLLGFSVTKVPEEITESHCVISDKINKDSATKSGIKLGLSKNDVVSSFGQHVSSDIMTPFWQAVPSERKIHSYKYSKEVKFSQEKIRQWIDIYNINQNDIECSNYYSSAFGTISFEYDLNDRVKKFTVFYSESY